MEQDKVISERLYKISTFVPKGTIVADIGTDHAYLPKYLITNERCPKVIATELRRGPFERAKKNIKSWGFEDKIQLRFGSGFLPIKPNEIDIAIIAGMGGNAISQIIENSREIVDSLNFIILQPMTCKQKLRYDLFRIGYQIIHEEIAKEDKRFYEIIVAKSSLNHYCYHPVDIMIGPILKQKQSQIVVEYLNFRKNRLHAILTDLNYSNTKASQKAIEKLEFELYLIEEVLKN